MHFTRCLADQMRPYDVTVNAIAPGDTRTERSSPPARLIQDGWSRPARLTGSLPLTKLHASLSFSRGRWARSYRVK